MIDKKSEGRERHLLYTFTGGLQRVVIIELSTRIFCVNTFLIAIVVIVMSPSMFSSSNGVYYVLIYLSIYLCV